MREPKINDLRDLLGRLSEDLSPTGLRLNASVFSLADQTWLAGGSGQRPEGFGPDGHVLVLPGRQKLLLAREDGGPSLSAVAGEVQEWAIDELGYGWPELEDEQGTFVALLEPTRIEGVWVWSEHGSARVPVGELSSLRLHIPPRAH